MSVEVLVLLRFIGETLRDFLWQGALIGAGTAGMLRLLKTACPRVRYAVLCVALILCALTPVARICGQWHEATYAPLPAAHVDVSGLLVTAHGTAGVDWMPWFALVWLAGVLAMTVRLAGGLAWVRDTVANSRRWVDPHWERRLAHLRARLRVRRSVHLHLSPRISGPFTVGWLRPVILVPTALITCMSPDLLEAILAHELAHVRRADYLVNLLQRLLETLLFFHPAVWWLSHRMRVERERIADDLAAQALGEPRSLALALDQLSRLGEHGYGSGPASMPFPQMARGADLVDRIRRLVHAETSQRRPGIAHSSVAVVGALGIIGLAIAMNFGVVSRDHETETPQRAAALGHSSLLGAFVDGLGATNVLVADAMSGDRLLERGANDVVPIASLTKLVTAMVVLDSRPDMKRALRIDQLDADATRGALSRLPVGASLPFQEMLRLALMASDNRAAHAIARSYPGGRRALDRAMQEKIATLGLRHTVLEEPTGASPNNKSTAADIGRIVDAAARYPEIAQGSTQASDRVSVGRATIEFLNSNPLVGQPGWKILLSKTARSEAAGPCVVMRVRTAGRELTVVVLNAPGLRARRAVS